MSTPNNELDEGLRALVNCGFRFCSEDAGQEQDNILLLSEARYEHGRVYLIGWIQFDGVSTPTVRLHPEGRGSLNTLREAVPSWPIEGEEGKEA